MKIEVEKLRSYEVKKKKLSASQPLNFSSSHLLNLSTSASGFTLIELIIVIFIISLTTALVMPNLWDRGERTLKSEAKRIGNTLRYIYDEAAGKKRTYVLKIDLNAGVWSFESEKESRSFKMKDNVMFKDIIVPSLGEVSIGEVIMKFGPMGPEEPITLHLIKDDNEYTVIFNHINGRAKILEGYFVNNEDRR